MPFYAILAAITVSFCWGANFTASKFAMEYFPPFLFIATRFVALSLLLLPFVIRRKLPAMREMVILSLLYITMHFAMIFIAMHMGLSVTSATSSVTVEAAYPQAAVDGLRALGYTVGNAEIGSVQAVVVDPRSGKQFGAADARREGTVIGLPRRQND